MDKEKIIGEAHKVLKSEAEAIEAVRQRLDVRFADAVAMIAACKGRLIVTGMGKSGLVGKKIAATLASTGTPSFFMHPAEASHGDLGMVTAEDIILALSNSGETAEVVLLLPFLKRFQVRLIAMTGNPNSTLSRAADVSLDVAVPSEACPMGIVPTSSTTAAIALGDALAVALLVERGFKEEDFAAFHPSGSLGKKLLTRVEDLMHSGASLPSVSSNNSVADTVMEVSGKRLGFTTVLDDKGALMGIFTDGDLRRGLEKHGEKFFRMKASEVMTRSPKTITPESLATKALALMQEYSITVLVVADASGKPVGAIHIHDILREGIV